MFALVKVVTALRLLSTPVRANRHPIVRDPRSGSERTRMNPTAPPASGSAAVDGFLNYQWLLHCEFTGSLTFVVDLPLEIG